MNKKFCETCKTVGYVPHTMGNGLYTLVPCPDCDGRGWFDTRTIYASPIIIEGINLRECTKWTDTWCARHKKLYLKYKNGELVHYGYF